MIRIGFSKDVHRFESGRKFMLGGIEIAHDRGSVGHSDGDCLLHAITEGMLGALALGDLGKWFPDSDPQYKDIDSSLLLKQAYQKILQMGYEINNIDTMVSLEKPKLQNYILNIRKKIAADLQIDIAQISVKATSFEGLGFVGLEEGIICEAIVVLRKISN